ncbi:MAG: hypothetical protein M5T61_06525 [Acidimicrobiia bacterium]|nr:hypothetical protein [Acidimicrobiia bacterium]
MTETDELIRRRLHSMADEMAFDASFAKLEQSIKRRSRRRSMFAAAVALLAVTVTGGIFMSTRGADEVVVTIVRGDADGQPGASGETTQPPEAPPPIRIDVNPVDYRGGTSNLILGTLHLDPNLRCLYLTAESGERYHLVFPYGSTVADDPVRVLDRNGKVFAVLDQPVEFGGSITEPESVEPSEATCGASKSIFVWKG